MRKPTGKAAKMLGDDPPPIFNPVETKVELFPGMKTDGLETRSSMDQAEIERLCTELLDSCAPERAHLFRELHQSYLVRGLTNLPSGYASLDASRPWILFWILHSLELLGLFDRRHSEADARRIYAFLDRCQASTGGFGGGPGQIAHLAPTYAATMSLVILGSEAGWKIVDRQRMYNFLMSVKRKEGLLKGGFAVTVGGEVDTRGTYITLAVASILNIVTPELVEGVAEFVGRNQTYEGGIGAEPGNEAHGGYTYCGLAALRIINRTDAVDLDALLRWATQRQMSLEGGFQGRTNKLVDSCYSWWVGGIFPLIQPLLNPMQRLTASDKTETNTSTETETETETDAKTESPTPTQDTTRSTSKATTTTDESQTNPSLSTPNNSENEQVNDLGLCLFDTEKLQEYIIFCCQMNHGGLRDKPGKRPDYYHTCYSLSGLSMAQHQLEADGKNGLRKTGPLGGRYNLLKETDPLYNATPARLARAMAFFRTLPLPVPISNSSSSGEGGEMEVEKKM